MDQAIPQNAAPAEAFASASEQLDDQTEQMRLFVNELQLLVGQGAGRRQNPRNASAEGTAVQAPVVPPGAAGADERLSPEQAIPPTEDDFRDF